MMSDYYLFLDESGDHGLNKIDENFPVFVLSGVVISHENNLNFKEQIISFKELFWGAEKKVILHSTDIRRIRKEFVILFNNEIKQSFYTQLNDIVTNTDFQIIASTINKASFVKKYGKLNEDVYGMSLNFILERTIFLLDSYKAKNEINNIRLTICIEKRGAKEDNQLKNHFNKLMQVGTYYISANRLNNYNITMHHKSKLDDIAGLQLADLIAYPIATHVIDPNRANPAFDLIKDKLYKRGNRIYGLKIFP